VGTRAVSYLSVGLEAHIKCADVEAFTFAT